MKIKIGLIKRLIKEELTTQPSQGGGLGKLIDDMSRVFALKMKESFPGADEAIQKESNDLKMQLTAIVKAAAVKVRFSVQKSS